MSTSPSPAAQSPAAKSSSFSRYFFLFLIGLVVGAVATVMAMRAIDARRDHYPDAVMTVMQAHMAQLDASTKANRCGATDVIPQLQTLRTMANDIEPAFGDLRDDERFGKHASNLRGTLNDLIASPPLNCAGVGKAAQKIGEACKACHQDFRS